MKSVKTRHTCLLPVSQEGQGGLLEATEGEGLPSHAPQESCSGKGKTHRRSQEVSEQFNVCVSEIANADYKPQGHI